MASWPTDLPPPLSASYNISPVQQVRRTDMETGAPRVRIQSRSIRDTVTVSWKMSLSQFNAFRLWFESMSGAAWGSAWFTIDLPVGRSATDIKTNVQARFAGNPPWSSALSNGGKLYTITATLETRQNV